MLPKASNFKVPAAEYDGYRATKRQKTSELDEQELSDKRKADDFHETPCSEPTPGLTAPSKQQSEATEHPMRKLSFSNFEPIQPKDLDPGAAKDPTPVERAAPTHSLQPDDYHFNISQLFGPAKPSGGHGDDARTGASVKCKPATKMESRMSFDFYELNADQLLESTPHSYRHEFKSKQREPNEFGA